MEVSMLPVVGNVVVGLLAAALLAATLRLRRSPK